MTRYLDIAQALRAQIQHGQWPHGSRLPGVRTLARSFAVSITTVQNACATLQDEGWIEARPRSGLYVRHQQPIIHAVPRQPPAADAPLPVSARELTAEVMQQSLQPHTVAMGAAIPATPFLGLSLLTRAQERTIRQRGHDLRYAVAPGLPALRQAIAQRLAQNGVAVDPGHIVITNGCHEALVLALKAATQPGDTVAIESPTYYGFLQAIEGLGLNILEIPNHPVTGLSLEALGFALDRWPIKALVVTPNFSNPMGCLMPAAAKAQLVALLRARGVVLIEDDIYGDLNHHGVRPDTCLHHDPAGDTVIQCSSVSKTLAPGLRIGWLISPRFAARVSEQKLLLNIATASHPQALVAEVLASHRWDRHLAQIRPLHAQAIARMQTAVARHFPEDTRISQPTGGFVLWIECPVATDTTALMRRARDARISITPGALFSVSGKFTHCLRLNCALPWQPAVEAAVAFLGQAVHADLRRTQTLVSGVHDVSHDPPGTS